jgi:hypothetical protein
VVGAASRIDREREVWVIIKAHRRRDPAFYPPLPMRGRGAFSTADPPEGWRNSGAVPETR